MEIISKITTQRWNNKNSLKRKKNKKTFQFQKQLKIKHELNQDTTQHTHGSIAYSGQTARCLNVNYSLSFTLVSKNQYATIQKHRSQYKAHDNDLACSHRVCVCIVQRIVCFLLYLIYHTIKPINTAAVIQRNTQKAKRVEDERKKNNKNHMCRAIVYLYVCLYACLSICLFACYFIRIVWLAISFWAIGAEHFVSLNSSISR